MLFSLYPFKKHNPNPLTLHKFSNHPVEEPAAVDSPEELDAEQTVESDIVSVDESEDEADNTESVQIDAGESVSWIQVFLFCVLFLLLFFSLFRSFEAGKKA